MLIDRIAGLVWCLARLTAKLSLSHSLSWIGLPFAVQRLDVCSTNVSAGGLKQ